MAVHRQPEDARGPRFRTVVPVEAPVSDVDPGAALRRIAQSPDWRDEAWAWLDAWNKVIADHIRRTYEAENRRRIAQVLACLRKAQDVDQDARQVVAALPTDRESAERYFGPEDVWIAPEDGVYQVTWPITEPPPDEQPSKPRFVDTGTFFYEIPEERR